MADITSPFKVYSFMSRLFRVPVLQMSLRCCSVHRSVATNMRTSTLLLLFPTLVLQHFGHGVRILGVFPMASHSHYTLGKTLLSALADRGHDVTVITPYKEEDKRLKPVYLDGIAEAMDAVKPKLDAFANKRSNILMNTMFVHFLGEFLVNNTLQHPAFQSLLSSEQSFDVVIVEQFVDEAFRGICHHYSASCVVFMSVESMYWSNIPSDNPQHPSYVPYMALEHFGPMDFFTRLQNCFLDVFTNLFYNFYVLPRQDQLMHQAFPSSPPLQDLLYKPTITLLNSHISTAAPAALLPSMIEVGGFHVKPPKKLPQELQAYLDEAKEGVVYFSMGSVLKSKDFPREKRDAVLRVFSKLKVKVLWKFEDENLENRPGNVRISKWLPQQDILAHPNVKLFISHGGALSTIEAIYHGVPVLGIPIYGDQAFNIKRAAYSGFALGLEYTSLSESSFSEALVEMLNNKKYVENAKRLSRLMHDRPMKPLDVATFWVEYAARHKDLEHMKPMSMELTWYQYRLLDVIAVVLGGTLLFVWLCIRCCCRRRSSNTRKDKKKKDQ